MEATISYRLQLVELLSAAFDAGYKAGAGEESRVAPSNVCTPEYQELRNGYVKGQCEKIKQGKFVDSWRPTVK